MVKVLQVIGSLDRAGAETMLMNIYRHLDQTQVVFDFVVYGEKKGDYEDEAISLGASIIHLQVPQKGYLHFYRNMQKIMRRGGYDAVHVHTLFNSGLVLRAARRAGIDKRICHSHSIQNRERENVISKFYAQLMRKMIKNNANAFLACGREAGRFLYGAPFFDRYGKVVRNTIDTNKFTYRDDVRKQTRTALGIGENTLVVGHIGRFSEVKNHTFLVDVFKEILDTEDNAVLLLIGDGELRAQIKDKVEQLEMVESVRFLGVRADTDKLLQAMDVLVFPSLFEGVPVTLIEAQSSGLPCVVSDRVPQETKITDLIYFFSLQKRAGQWAEKVLECAATPRRDYARQVLDSGYDIKKTTTFLQTLYLGVLDEE